MSVSMSVCTYDGWDTYAMVADLKNHWKPCLTAVKAFSSAKDLM